MVVQLKYAVRMTNPRKSVDSSGDQSLVYCFTIRSTALVPSAYRTSTSKSLSHKARGQ